MTDPKVAKVVYVNGNNSETWMDVTQDSVASGTLLSGETATGADGVRLTGSLTVPVPATESPVMDGTAAVGTSTKYAREDHVHPSDTSKQAKITASGILKGNGSGTVSAATAGTDYQAPLPTQTGNSGKFLTTNGSALSWGAVDALPSQTSQSGKFLTTNGSTASWANAPTEIPTQTGNSGKYLTTNGSAVSWGSISIPSASSSTPVMDGTGAAGTSSNYARADHVHPTDTSLVPTSRTINGKALTGNISLDASDVSALPSSTTVPTASTTAPSMDGTASYGSGTSYARSNHVHPTDTSRAPLASPTFTGTPAAPTATAGTNTTQIATTAFVNTAIGNKITYGDTDLTAGSSALTTGVFYFVYE